VQFDLYKLESISNLFKNKQPHKIEKYLQVLTSLSAKAITESA